ncbi:MAG TPA: phosphate ABC transporter substrate-binding protein PstS, partial [Gemmatimonadaceae bacterium]|nr:phosphate ABC transporter substrate-binding protein PstS [Gemmatimonadaceae bacterium]
MKAVKLAVFVLFAVACAKEGNNSSTASSTSSSSGSVDLTGAGATFPYPLYSKWFDEYAKLTGVKMNYQSIGSGGGIRQLSEGTVDFGASDSPMSDAELAKAKFGPILHIPTVLGAVVITYNIASLSAPLDLTPQVIADIFGGKITKWNDARIASLNPTASLPSSDILVVHRSDGSGTTYIFTDYLSTAVPSWKGTIGNGKEVNWPVGLGAKGNEGVAGQVKQTPGAIGYVELAYAKQNKLPIAAVKNKAGKFVIASVPAVTAAAAGVANTLPANTDFRVSVVDAPGPDAYPISSFTWILAYQHQRDSVKGKKLVDFLNWALTYGEPEAPSLDYGPLPSEMTPKVKAKVATID